VVCINIKKGDVKMMDIRDRPTVVNYDGKPVTKVVKNSDAKTIAIMLKMAGYNESKITFSFPDKLRK